MLRPLLRSEVGEVSNRRAWHEPAKLTAEVLEHYKRPLRARNWDAALVEVPKPNPLPNRTAIQSLSAGPLDVCWLQQHNRDSWSAVCCPQLHLPLHQQDYAISLTRAVILLSQVSRLPREVTERQLAGLCGAAARLPAAVATGAHDRVSPTTCAAQLVRAAT